MMQAEDWSGMFVTLGGIDKAGHMWGAQQDANTFTGDCNAANDALRGANQTHVRCAAENADVQLGKLRAAIAGLDAENGGETLVVLTADHGATYGKAFHGKTHRRARATATGTTRPNASRTRGASIDRRSPATTRRRRRCGR